MLAHGALMAVPFSMVKTKQQNKYRRGGGVRRNDAQVAEKLHGIHQLPARIERRRREGGMDGVARVNSIVLPIIGTSSCGPEREAQALGVDF